MKRILLALALLWSGSVHAQYAQQLGGSGSLVIGTTPITGGATTQVLYNLGGVVTSDSGLTYSGGGTTAVLSIGNTIQFTGTNPGLIKSVSSGALSIWATSVTYTTAAGTTIFSIIPNSDGVFSVTNTAGTSFGRMQFGGTTSAFPSIKRNSAAIETRLADDSASANLITASISATLASATGTNAVCNTPGTNTALTVQVWATGCAASSARFKNAITALDTEKAFKTVLGLAPVSYFYKPEFNMGLDKHIGFTAEQVATVDPFLVTFEDDGVTPHAVKYNEMAPLFAAAIQKLQSEIEALKASR